MGADRGERPGSRHARAGHRACDRSGSPSHDRRRRIARGSGPRPGFGLGIAALAVAWVLICAQAIPLLANREVARSQAAVGRSELASALKHANAARDIQPWAASPYVQLALVNEEAGALARARDWINEAIDRDRRNWRLWLVLARLETKLGYPRAAADSLRRAIELNPRSPLFQGLLDSAAGLSFRQGRRRGHRDDAVSASARCGATQVTIRDASATVTLVGYCSRRMREPSSPAVETRGAPSSSTADVPAAERAISAWPRRGSRVWRYALLRRLLALADVSAVLLASLSLLLAGAGQAGQFAWSLVVLPLWIVIAKLLGLYDRDERALRHLTVDETPHLVLWAVLGASAVSVVLELGSPGWPSASSALTLAVVAGVSAFVLRALMRLAWRTTTPPERVAIIGAPAAARSIRRKLELFPGRPHDRRLGARDRQTR